MRLPEPAGSRVVVVGAAEFRDPDLADLVRILTAPTGTGLPAEHCAVVADESAFAGLGDRVEEAAKRRMTSCCSTTRATACRTTTAGSTSPRRPRT